ncbi:hypothetical protein [Thermococcus sp. MV11]|uniref:hypothetical protein n=1 Tax=Thermococcus sp. MV11 TaxID=1638267 RepID=UPI00142FD2C9|nr:hypothetical protein [Thermococcus sp. MV11]NJE04489.1 hypothetical protein [Thermococcus sp. MV11]
MRFELSLRRVEYLLVAVSSLPLAWLFSHRTGGFLVSAYLHELIGVWIPPFPLLLLVSALLSLGLYLFAESALKTVGIQFALYLLPSLYGLPVGLLTGYTLGGVLYITVLLIVSHIDWITQESETALRAGISREELESSALSAIKEALFPVPLGAGYLFLVLRWSSWAELPERAFPFYLLTPFLLGAAVAVASSFSRAKGEKLEDASETFLVLRTYMTAGDSFTVEYLGRDERGITLGLMGGSPVKRPVLLRLGWEEGVPAVVVLRSPWETRILTKEKEWVEGGKRYVLFMA